MLKTVLSALRLALRHPPLRCQDLRFVDSLGAGFSSRSSFIPPRNQRLRGGDSQLTKIMPVNSPNTQPIFIRTPTIQSIVLATELGDTLPTSTLIPKTFVVASDPATAIETIEIINTGASVATILNLYLYSATGTQGQSRLISQTFIPAATAAPYVPIQVVLPRSLSPVNEAIPSRIIRIPTGWELRVALSVAIANPVIVTAFGGSYY